MSSSERQVIELSRDCPAVAIPSGQAVGLRRGERVVVIQTLGGSFTVRSDGGLLARIDSNDADALGLNPETAGGDRHRVSGPFDMEQVVDQLRTVYDPEIPINVVDLGLIYSCNARPLPGGGQRIDITMSMTAPGCGMGDVLRHEASAKVLSVPDVREVDVELVWDPPWDIQRISEEGRLELGLL